MRIEWLHEAQMEYKEFLLFYKNKVGIQYAEAFAKKILSCVNQLADFPEMGVQKDNLLGRYGFRALFVDKYVVIYRISTTEDKVLIYYFTDARSNYIYNIFGLSND
jgi:toxin ParE1/3/4